jgi:hypothetical protein
MAPPPAASSPPPAPRAGPRSRPPSPRRPAGPAPSEGAPPVGPASPRGARVPPPRASPTSERRYRPGEDAGVGRPRPRPGAGAARRAAPSRAPRSTTPPSPRARLPAGTARAGWPTRRVASRSSVRECERCRRLAGGRRGPEAAPATRPPCRRARAPREGREERHGPHGRQPVAVGVGEDVGRQQARPLARPRELPEQRRRAVAVAVHEPRLPGAGEPGPERPADEQRRPGGEPAPVPARAAATARSGATGTRKRAGGLKPPRHMCHVPAVSRTTSDGGPGGGRQPAIAPPQEEEAGDREGENRRVGEQAELLVEQQAGSPSRASPARTRAGDRTPGAGPRTRRAPGGRRGGPPPRRRTAPGSRRPGAHAGAATARARPPGRRAARSAR